MVDLLLDQYLKIATLALMFFQYLGGGRKSGEVIIKERGNIAGIAQKQLLITMNDP